MRLRITFEKNKDMRYTGHLDLHRTWERTFRRARLPLAYSQGFHPQPKIQLAAALPLGFTSQSEYADVWLEEDLPLFEVEKALLAALPPGIHAQKVEVVGPKEPFLQTRVIGAVYEVTLLDTHPDLDETLESLLAAPQIPRERRGKPYNLRELIEELVRLPDDDQDRPRLRMRLSSRPGATGRPEEVLDVMGVPAHAARIHRTHIILE